MKLPQHIHCVRVRGYEYFYFQKFRGTKLQGPRHKMPGAPQNPDGSPNTEWWLKYRQLSGAVEVSQKPGTVAALIAAFKASGKWSGISPKTRYEWARYLDFVEKSWGDLPVKGIEPHHVSDLIESYADVPPSDPKLCAKPLEKYKNRPAAANNLLRALKTTLKWATQKGWRKDNPCREVEELDGGAPYAAWPWEMIELVRTDGPRWLWWAVALALYTGQREDDCLKMMWSNIRNGFIKVLPQKTRKKKPEPMWIPIHRDLQIVLDEIREHMKSEKVNSVYILNSSRGTRWTKNGFTSSWSTVMNGKTRPRKGREPKLRPTPLMAIREAGLVFHGLRKSAVVFMLEAGCTTQEVSAITGQSLQMVEHYAKMVSQQKLAVSAILKWERAPAGGELRTG